MILCFLCGTDITNGPQVKSYHLFPDSFHHKEEYRNGPICSDCANKDLKIAHNLAVARRREYVKEEIDDGIRTGLQNEIKKMKSRIGFKLLKLFRVI